MSVCARLGFIACLTETMQTERKFVTVMFVDFAGALTGSGEQPAQLNGSSAISARVDAIIAAHGGTANARIGDAMIAMFGAGQVHEEDPARAVRAALALQAAFPD